MSSLRVFFGFLFLFSFSFLNSQNKNHKDYLSYFNTRFDSIDKLYYSSPMDPYYNALHGLKADLSDAIQDKKNQDSIQYLEKIMDNTILGLIFHFNKKNQRDMDIDLDYEFTGKFGKINAKQQFFLR